jgi:hypothetical protein
MKLLSIAALLWAAPALGFQVSNGCQKNVTHWLVLQMFIYVYVYICVYIYIDFHN